MRQIPSEGEFCGECPCLNTCKDRCQRYTYADGNFFTELERYGEHRKRLPQCLKDNPQVLTAQERAALAQGHVNLVGYHDGKAKP